MRADYFLLTAVNFIFERSFTEPSKALEYMTKPEAQKDKCLKAIELAKIFSDIHLMGAESLAKKLHP